MNAVRFARHVNGLMNIQAQGTGPEKLAYASAGLLAWIAISKYLRDVLRRLPTMTSHDDLAPLTTALSALKLWRTDRTRVAQLIGTGWLRDGVDAGAQT